MKFLKLLVICSFLLIPLGVFAYHDQLDYRYEGWYQEKLRYEVHYFYDRRNEVDILDLVSLMEEEDYKGTLVFEKLYFDNQLINVNLCWKIINDPDEANCRYE